MSEPQYDKRFAPQGNARRHPEYEQAALMIRNGSTAGMVRKFLREQGLSLEESNLVIAKAQSSTTRRARTKGTFWMIGGALMVAAGITAVLIRANNNAAGGMRPLFYLIMGGIMVFCKGLIDAVSGIDSK